MKKILLIVITSLAISGCSFGHIIENYGAFSPVVRSDFDYQNESYRMFDRKDLSTIMITASLGSAMTNGAVRDATFGGLNPDDDQTRYSNVASAYLAKDRPDKLCKVIEGKLLVTPQWEFVYLCSDKPKI